jgi:hypothetical protein
MSEDGFVPPSSEAWREISNTPVKCPCCEGELAIGYVEAPLTITWHAGKPPGFFTLKTAKGFAVGGENRAFRPSRPCAWRCIVCGCVIVPPQPP